MHTVTVHDWRNQVMADHLETIILPKMMVEIP